VAFINGWHFALLAKCDKHITNIVMSATKSHTLNTPKAGTHHVREYIL